MENVTLCKVRYKIQETLFNVGLYTETRANKPQAVSDWLNLHSLGTMLLLALGYIENLVKLNLLPENH